MDELLKISLKILAIGGIWGFVTYRLMLWFGRKWIENELHKQLENHKHAHNQELERLKYYINAQFNRITKIHEIEIEVLPKAWIKLQMALGKISDVVSLYQSYPNIGSMEESQLEDFLKDSKLNDYDKQVIFKADKRERQEIYIDRYNWQRINESYKCLSDFHNYILCNKIFLSEDLFKSFKDIDDLLRKALLNVRIGKESKDSKYIIEAYKDINDKTGTMNSNIEVLVQRRLHYEEAEGEKDI